MLKMLYCLKHEWAKIKKKKNCFVLFLRFPIEIKCSGLQISMILAIEENI